MMNILERLRKTERKKERKRERKREKEIGLRVLNETKG